MLHVIFPVQDHYELIFWYSLQASLACLVWYETYFGPEISWLAPDNLAGPVRSG